MENDDEEESEKDHFYFTNPYYRAMKPDQIITLFNLSVRDVDMWDDQHDLRYDHNPNHCSLYTADHKSNQIVAKFRC